MSSGNWQHIFVAHYFCGVLTQILGKKTHGRKRFPSKGKGKTRKAKVVVYHDGIGRKPTKKERIVIRRRRRIE